MGLPACWELQVADEHGVPLPALSLQFSLAHPVAASLVTGFGSPTELEQCVDWLRTPVPDAVWEDLKAKQLIHPEAPTPLM